MRSQSSIATALLGPCAALAGILIASQLDAQDTNAGVRLEYRIVAFTEELLRNDDRRFSGAMTEGRLGRGVRLVSREPALYSIAWINGLSSGTLCDGRGFFILPHYLAPDGFSEFRVARTIELAGGYRDRAGEINPAPTSYPDIRGYRFIVADSVSRRHFVGLWRRIRGRDETLIVAFHAASAGSPATHQIIGRFPLRLNSIYLHGGLHIWYINVISEARVGQPIYILSYSLSPDILPYGSRARRYDPGVRR